MKNEAFIEQLYAIGWDSPRDAQHKQITKFLDDLRENSALVDPPLYAFYPDAPGWWWNIQEQRMVLMDYYRHSLPLCEKVSDKPEFLVFEEYGDWCGPFKLPVKA